MLSNNSAYQSLLTYFANSENSDEIGAILSALLTDKEQLEIANRIRIFDLLEQGVTQREVAQQLGVGVATVSRGAKALQHHDISALLAIHRRE